ncbi:MAG: zinc transporter ZupT [Bacteroidaceae bacterium]|nr:zinc transporter ZupT [Bacteroidaceae bacterium]
MNNSILIAFLLTLLAGLSTGVGSAIAFFTRRTNTTFLSVSLGFSAGVMIYVSFVELFPNALAAISTHHGEKIGALWTTLAFFGGILFILLIDFFVPETENPHEMHEVEELSSTDVAAPQLSKSALRVRLLRTGLITAIVLGIHNFPEGMVTFLTAMDDLSLAVPIAIAIAIHNIPEGIAVSVPIYYATGNRAKAFWFSFSSGLAEPVGALIGYLLLAPFFTDDMLGFVFAGIAGIMVYISLDELLPSAERYGKHHFAIFGLIAGMAVMAASLLLLK